MTCETAPCPRCGRRRFVANGAARELCKDCKDVIAASRVTKYAHTFPILDETLTTFELIAEACYRHLAPLIPRGHHFSRYEWHRRPGELVMVCDCSLIVAAEEPEPVVEALPRWVRDGLIWRAVAA